MEDQPPPPQAPGGLPPPQGPPLGYPPTYGAAQPGFGQQLPKTSGLAIAALVTAFFCWLASIPLAIIALVKIKGSNGQLKGKGLAIAGLIISVLGIVAVVGLVIVADRDLKTVNELSTGDCLNLPEPDADGSIGFFALDAVDCAEPHDARVLRAFSEPLDDDNRDLSVDEITVASLDECSEPFLDETGSDVLESDEFDMRVVWDERFDERNLACLLVRIDGAPLEG